MNYEPLGTVNFGDAVVAPAVMPPPGMHLAFDEKGRYIGIRPDTPDFVVAPDIMPPPGMHLAFDEKGRYIGMRPDTPALRDIHDEKVAEGQLPQEAASTSGTRGNIAPLLIGGLAVAALTGVLG